MLPHRVLIGTRIVFRGGPLRTQIGTAWNLLQEEVNPEPVVAVSEMCEAVVASTIKGREVHCPSALGSESLPNVVGAPEGAKDLR